MIVRKERVNNFTIIPNDILSDTRISLEARAVLSYLLSKPDNWNVNCADIQGAGNIGRNKAYAILGELIEAGYVHRQEFVGHGGKYRYEYTVYDHSSVEIGDRSSVKIRDRTSVRIRDTYKDSIDNNIALVAKATKEETSSSEGYDPKKVLFRELLPKAVSYSGMSEAKLRPLFGRWLKTTNDDAELLADVVRAAFDYQPGEFVSFVTGSLKHKMGKTEDHKAWMDAWK